MNLPAFLDENGSLAVYRVVKDNFPGEDQLVIDRNTQAIKAERIVVEQAYFLARKIVYGDEDPDYDVAYTDPQPYLTGSETSITDIFVFAEGEAASKVLEEKLKKSKQRKEELINYREERVKPFLSRLAKKPFVHGIGFRGDLVQEERHATPFSDINNIIITERSSEKIRDKIKQESPGTIEILDFVRNDEGDEIVKKREDDPVVSYDIWSLEEFKKNMETEWKENSYKKKYFHQMDWYYRGFS